MSKYRANPEEARAEFKNLIDKLASCVRLEDVKEKAPLFRVKNELVTYNNNLLSTAMSSVIEKLCNSVDLDTKLTRLHELEGENVEKAWRPETSNWDATSIQGDHLRKQRKMLMKSLENAMKESNELQTEIEAKRREIFEQKEEVVKYIKEEKNKIK